MKHVRRLVVGAMVFVAAAVIVCGQGRGRGPLDGAVAGFVVNPAYDSEAPALPTDLASGGVLVFSKTNGYRDEASVEASNAALAAIATMRGWPSFVTENGAVMNAEQLAKFKLVIWNNASGDVLTEPQRAAFKNWVEAGGSYLGVHGAGGDPVVSPGHTSLADWTWYVDDLVGAQFVVHSSIMPGDIHIEDAKSPITRGCPPCGTAPRNGTPSRRVLAASRASTSWRPSTRRATRPAVRRWGRTIRWCGGIASARATRCTPRSATRPSSIRSR